VNRRLSLRVRLLAGLLLVTTIGLFVTGLISTIVLQTYLLERLDAQLSVAVDRASQQGQGGQHRPIEQAIAPSRYVMALMDPSRGRIQHLNGDGPEVLAAQRSLRRTRVDQLRRYADSEKPFELEPRTGPTLRACAGYNRAGQIVVVAAGMDDINDSTHQLIITEAATGAGLVILIAAGGRWLITRGLAPLAGMATTAQRVSGGGDLSARMPGADDETETGRLASAINTMLVRIERSFAARLESERRVRAFAADASHELRTPLTTIRGYAELSRQGAIAPEDLPAAMARIESEAARMSRLVAELLELARLDRSATLEMTATDLAGAVREAAADARMVEPDRPITVEAPDSLTAVVDEPRFRQVVANLLTNVREHTPAGTAVTLRLERPADAVLFEIHDAGPGMDPQVAARAFDRFSRGTDIRRTTGGKDGPPSAGSGLGLAIVQAIVASHDGSVTLDSAPGAGTTVRVLIPDHPLLPGDPGPDAGDAPFG
jgi:two-component system OmpR family sensor kinase